MNEPNLSVNSKKLMQQGDVEFLDATIEVLQKTVSDLSRKMARLTDEKWAKDLEVEELRSNEVTRQSEIARLRDECNAYSKSLFEAAEKRTMIERAFNETQAKLQVANEETAKALRQAKQAHLHELEFLQETNTALNQQVAHLGSENLRLQSETATLNQAVKEFELAKLERDRMLLEARQQLSEARAKHDIVQKKIESASSENTQAQVQHEQEKLRLQKRIEELEARCDEQNGQLEQARDVVDAFEQAIESSRVELQSARENAVRALRETNQQNAQRTEALLQQQQQLNSEISRLRGDQGRLEQALANSEQQAHETRERLEVEFQKRVEGILADNIQLRKMIEAKDAHVEELQNKLHQWQSQMESREQTLRANSESTAREKSETLRLAKQLMSELQMAKTTHPLKDFLGITEGELTKLYGQLKSAPLHTTERARLEEAMAKMLKKREFLNSVLMQSQKHLEEKASMVLSSLQNMNQ